MQVTSVQRKLKWKWWSMFVVHILFAPIISLIACMVVWRITHPKRGKVLKETPDAYHLRFKDVSFLSNDKKTNLKGWMITSEANKGTIIFSHGYCGNRLKSPHQSLALAKRYVEQGYRVLLFDYRNSGESDGTMSTIGVLETEDLIGAIDFVRHTQPGPIFLIGWSTGGASSIMAAAQRKVDAIISDSAFDDLEAYMDENMTKWTKLPRLFNPYIIFFIPFVSGGRHPRMSKPIASLEQIDCPIYFIHGKCDSKIPHTTSVSMHQVYKGEKALWITEEGDHITNHLTYSEYAEKTLMFLDGVSAGGNDGRCNRVIQDSEQPVQEKELQKV